jgi:hypothetical protein
MRNQTTVTDVSLGGAVALLVLWVLGYFQPEFVETLPTGGEAAIALVITALFSYIKEPRK